MQTSTYTPKNTPQEHLLSFYKTFREVSANRYDGMIITGAPVEQLPFEQVEYWGELCEIMEWSKANVHSVLHKMCIRDSVNDALTRSEESVAAALNELHRVKQQFKQIPPTK